MDVDNQDNQQESVNIGALLIEARENQKWSAQDIASQMNLSLTMIESLEANQFNQELPLTFIRGYINSYAKKVGLDAELLCAEFDSQTLKDTPAITKIKSVSNFQSTNKEINSSHSLFKLVTYLIILLLISFAIWKFWKRMTVENENANDLELQSITVSEEDLLEEPLAQNQIETNQQSLDLGKNLDNSVALNNSLDLERDIVDKNIVDKNVVEENTTEEKDQINLDALKEKTPVENDLKIKMELSFSADCWVKMTDGLDKVIAVGTKKNDRIMQLNAVPPVSIILGEPSAVNLIVNDRPYDLSAFPAGQIAKFKLK